MPKNQNNDREEFEKLIKLCEFGVNESITDIEKLWNYFQSYTQKKVEEERKKIFKDLIKIADKGEIEELRREVTCYFKSKQQERLRKICEKNKDDMTGLYDYDGIVSGVLSILEEEQK